MRFVSIFSVALILSLSSCASVLVPDVENELGDARAKFFKAIDGGSIRTINGLSANFDYRMVYATAWVPGREGKQAKIVMYDLGVEAEPEPRPIFPRSIYSDYQPIFDFDGWLLFTSTRPLDNSQESVRQNVWYSRRLGSAKWSTPSPVKGLESPSWDGHALLLSPKRILFASGRDGGSGMVDFYEADFVNGVAYNIVNARNLNSKHSDNDGSFHRSSGVLIFSRYIEKRNDLDLFYSRRVNGHWERPQAITLVNTEDWEYSPFITSDGCQLIFKRRGTSFLLRVPTREINLGFMCDYR